MARGGETGRLVGGERRKKGTKERGFSGGFQTKMEKETEEVKGLRSPAKKEVVV